MSQQLEKINYKKLLLNIMRSVSNKIKYSFFPKRICNAKTL